MKKPVSIQDIARAAGVSHTTVSRALRDSPLISAEIREQIYQLAGEMGYVPNAVAQSLRGKRTHTVGLVVTTIADPFVGRVVRGIEEVAQQYSLSLLLSVSNNDPDQEINLIETFHHRRVDGIIVTATQMTARHEKRLARIPVPTVLINQQGEDALKQFHSVSVDDDGGMRAAVLHLLGLGHRAIGYMGAANRPRSNRTRLQAYQSALKEAGIPFHSGWVQTAPIEHRYHSDDVIDGQTLLAPLLSAGVTAICCFNDMIASGALLACRALNLQVPRQVSLVGFDDIELAQLVSPSLTTVHQPKLRLGQVAMEMLHAVLEDRPVEDIVLPTELTIRESTGPVPDRLPKDEIQPSSSTPIFIPR